MPWYEVLYIADLTVANALFSNFLMSATLWLCWHIFSRMKCFSMQISYWDECPLWSRFNYTVV